MYTPKHFLLDDPALQRQLVAEHPLALLVAADARDPGAPPLALHLPMVWVEEGGQSWLEGHLARGNPHLAGLVEGQSVRLVFTGPDAYVSPSHYDSPLNVPTWNYLALEVEGRLQRVDDAMAKDRLLKRLIQPRDPAYVLQWLGLPDDYQQRLLGAIVGLRVAVRSIQAKAKLSQNRAAGERQRLIEHFDSGASPAMARWMRQLGL
ncbi:FMN-binding negative transcriptional regulator [Mitsuaria sp. WAJ17]|uniref:FMN-binding negative transcriptional regulator n=1 Tax=Mitsuaria sp. WAJ17 TaxID=2761452 RepID=UPI001601B403|nr:FMN-binding negative transcriptional regulator [Mitsuaria sp. WAJ17]MBB2485369.1 FMN-binding negative transcriptional regulator [Mitsuaria sp. WAJ17]